MKITFEFRIISAAVVVEGKLIFNALTSNLKTIEMSSSSLKKTLLCHSVLKAKLNFFFLFLCPSFEGNQVLETFIDKGEICFGKSILDKRMRIQK